MENKTTKVRLSKRNCYICTSLFNTCFIQAVQWKCYQGRQNYYFSLTVQNLGIWMLCPMPSGANESFCTSCICHFCSPVKQAGNTMSTLISKIKCLNSLYFMRLFLKMPLFWHIHTKLSILTLNFTSTSHFPKLNTKHQTMHCHWNKQYSCSYFTAKVAHVVSAMVSILGTPIYQHNFCPNNM